MGKRAMRRNGEKLAFVLSGGGALGSMQVGCLEVLIEHGVVPDLIVGTSVGAVNGAWLAKYPSIKGIRKLKDIWVSYLGEQLIPESKLHHLFRLFLGKNYISTNRSLRQLLCQHLNNSTMFYDLEIPLYITSTNLNTGQMKVFNEGPVMPAILASTAIPGLFEPVVIEGNQYVDGAIISNCSIETALSNGATTIIAIECPHLRPAKGNGLLNVLKQVSWISLSRLCHLERERFRGKCTLIVLEPELRGIDTFDITDFSKTNYLIHTARSWTESFIKENCLSLMVDMVDVNSFFYNNNRSNLEGNTDTYETRCASCNWKQLCGGCAAPEKIRLYSNLQKGG